MIEIAWHIGLGVVGFIVGSKAPDIDLAPVFPLRHRSGWTHGPAFGLLAWWFLAPLYWWACVGFLAGLVLHLLADSWPKQWKGSALINFFPLAVSLPAWASMLYIFGSACFTAWVVWMLL